METFLDPRLNATPIREDSPTPEVIEWTLQRFARQNMVISTSFGMEGCALIDMYARHGKALTVFYLDTMFFFTETYELCDRLKEKYPHLKFENRGTTLTPEEQAERMGPELWKTDPNRCCFLRKVEPMYDAMEGVDVWISGLRRSQSATRANLRLVEWDWKYQVLKINPLFGWEREQIWEYIRANDVPYNVLHERGYPTIGCTHCTVAVQGSSPAEYTREGRWNGKSKTECGLHGDGI